MKKTLVALAAVLLLSACADAPPPPVQLESDTSPKINLDVLSVVVVDRTSQMDGDVYTRNGLQPTISNALRRWAIEKLNAVGTTGEAIVAIKDATLKWEHIPHNDSLFTREQASKYSGHADIEISVTGREGHGMVTANAAQFETLPEDPSGIERKNAYARLLNHLMQDVGENARRGITEHLSQFIITAPILPPQ